MKLAKALLQRADLQAKLDDISSRLYANAKVQEGENPAENPIELIAAKDEMIAELETLIARINLTNSKTEIDGVSLTEMLAKRDCLKLDIKIMRNFLSNASDKINRYSKSEIVIKSSVDVAELQKNVDSLSKELRELDEKIQELNWTVELM